MKKNIEHQFVLLTLVFSVALATSVIVQTTFADNGLGIVSAGLMPSDESPIDRAAVRVTEASRPPMAPATLELVKDMMPPTPVTQLFQKKGAGKGVEKAPKLVPANPFSFKIAPATDFQAPQISTRISLDSTPPIPPSHVNASVQGLSTIQANWDAATDPESGISYYMFGIGTVPTGTYSTLANTRWWQVTYNTSMSVGLTLDPAKTYYVSVIAVNGAGAQSPIITSGPVSPVWHNLGQQSNTITLAFAPAGLDTSGNPTVPGWTPAQIATMTAFFNKMYPILVQLYGPPADSYTLTVVRDLRYHSSNIFIPSLDEMHKDDGFYPQLFTHELVHAFRDHYILSSDANWNFDPTLSGFEESFAQGVSYEAMNKYIAQYPNDDIVPSNSLYGSSFDWDYDYQNAPELRGTDFWSDGGGTNLFWVRYEVGAAAIRKINIESPGFYKAFNQEYYNRINANPVTVRPTRALIVDIIKTLVPRIEGIAADTWLNKQNIFYAQNVYGDKIFHNTQDYPWNDFFAFHTMYFLDTMSCGSEWACWNGSQWVYQHMNGSAGTGKLTDYAGNVIWSGDLLTTPTGNPSDGTFAFGSQTKSLTTAASLQPWPGGSEDNYILNITPFGLYKFQSSFTDPNNGQVVTNNIYRVMGSSLKNNYGIWGGVIGHQNGTIYINHEGYPDEPGLPVTNGAFVGTRAWAGIHNSTTGGYDSVPGKVFVKFVDSRTGKTYTAQRNIDYGSQNGNQMFLFEFPGSPVGPIDGVRIQLAPQQNQ